MGKVLSYDDKVEMIRLWKEEGFSILKLREHFGCSKSVIERWRNRYSQHGLDGLKGSVTRSPYSSEMKRKILSELEAGVSKRKILAKYQMSNSTLSKWLLNCRCMEKIDVTKAVEPEDIKNLRKKYNGNPEIQEILSRLEYSEMENACLKKLETLVRARKEKKQKQSEN